MEIARGRLRVAGLCLACAMIKPQLSVPLTAWLLVWVSGNWQERKSLLLSFTATTSILLLGAELALPHWFYNWWHSLPAYLSYTGSKSSLQRLFGSVPGFVVALLLVVAVTTMGWKLRKHPAQSERFGFAFCLVLSITLVLIPTFSLASYNEVLLIPPFYGSVPHGRTPSFHASASWCGYSRPWHSLGNLSPPAPSRLHRGGSPAS